jgi:hypothetical protein
MSDIQKKLEIARAVAAITCGFAACYVMVSPDGQHLDSRSTSFYLSYALLAAGGFFGSMSPKLDYILGLFFPAVGYLICGLIVAGLSNKFLILWIVFFAIPSMFASLAGALLGVFACHVFRTVWQTLSSTTPMKSASPRKSD